MLHSKWLEEKQATVGIVYAHIAMHEPVELAAIVPQDEDSDSPAEAEVINMPVRLALRQPSTEEWIKRKADDRRYGNVPRLPNNSQDDPDISDERVAANYKWMKDCVREFAIGINDVHPVTGEESWHHLVILADDDARPAGYDEETDTLFLKMQRLDAPGAMKECSDALVGNANYGAGVGRLPFRPFFYDPTRANGGNVRQDA